MRLHWIAAIAVFMLSCSSGSNDNSAPNTVLEDDCFTAHYDSVRLMNDAAYEQALERLGEAMELCRPYDEKLHKVQTLIIGIGATDPNLCSAAHSLFNMVESTQDTHVLLAMAKLNYVCPTTSREHHLAALVDILAEETYGTDASAMRDFVWHSQEAQVRFSAGDDRVVDSLRRAIQELCVSDEVLSRAISVMGSAPINSENPGSALGLWMVQPLDSIDPASRQCLQRIADEVENRSHEFEPRMANDMDQWLAWVRGIMS